MGQVGNLVAFFGPKIRSAVISVPLVSSSQAPPLVSALYLFSQLSEIDICIASKQTELDQRLVCAVCELPKLRSVHIRGGALRHEDLNLELSLRGSHEHLTDRGLHKLADAESLRGLTHLSIMPLGAEVTRAGITELMEAMPHLKQLGVGIMHCGQIVAVAPAANKGARLKVVVQDPDMGAELKSGLEAPTHFTPDSLGSFFSACTLCLHSSLRCLRLGSFLAPDASFLLALGSLVNLTELKLSVSPATRVTPPFSIQLSKLTSLKKLTVLDVACCKSVQLPLTPKLISLMSMVWTDLQSLSLSVMKAKELVPESLELLDQLKKLRTLVLYCKLDMDEGSVGDAVPLYLKYLPAELERLSLEGVALEVCPQHHRKNSEQEGSASVGAESAEVPCPLPAVLTGLKHLELDECSMEDGALQHLLRNSSGLRHLELNEVTGLTNGGLASALHSLGKLEYLAVAAGQRQEACVQVNEVTSWLQQSGITGSSGASCLQQSGITGRNGASWLQQAGITGSSGACKEGSATTKGDGRLSSLFFSQLQHALGSSAGSLRHLDSSKTEDASSDGGLTEEEALQLKSEYAKAQAWRNALEQRLPLCHIARHGAMVNFDVWEDRLLVDY
eukprot:gene14185-20154_t